MLFSPIETFLQHRNTFLDNFFYDTDSLTKEETERLTSEKNPEGSIIGIGSGGNYALSAAKALIDTDLTAEEIALKSLKIAGEICVFTNSNVTLEKIEY